MARDKLSKAQQQAVDFIQSKGAAKMGELGTEVGKMLAELTAELMDAKQEASYWKAACETVRKEFTVAVGLVLKKSGEPNLVITRQDLSSMPPNTELWLDDHDQGVRIYALREVIRERPAVAGAISRIIRSH